MNTDSYFQDLNQMLRSSERSIPSLVIDLDRLDANIDLLQQDIHPDGDYRIVVKSLPSYDLVRYIMDRADCHKLMVFHQPFLTDLTGRLDDKVDILIGKPMPIKTAEYYYHHLPEHTSGFDPCRQVQWLVDTDTRLLQYVELARALGYRLRINLEIDVGLHRGGFRSVDDLSKALDILVSNRDFVQLSGLMGYDPHVVKLPSIIRTQKKALQIAVDFYNQCKYLLRTNYPSLWRENLCFNGAGSPTIRLHKDVTPLNDLSAGSCLVMPTTFDIPTLEGYQPACFIATPILKKFDGTTLPGMEGIKGALNVFDSANQQSCFIYGGFWKADYHYPTGLKQNNLFGASTNQTMLNAPDSAKLEVDDFVFLRPHQSEFVFLQFGEILPYRAGKLASPWSLLTNK